MKTTDYLVKSITKDGKFRAYAVNATQLVERAHEIHDTWSTASAALGRSLIGTLLLASAGLEGDSVMKVQIQGNGPVGYIVVDGNAHGTVKGYMGNPHVNLPANAKGKLDVAGAVGKQGTLSVTKMAPGNKTPYTGEVNLVSGELGDDFTYYLAQSEQIPSAVGLSVFVDTDDSIEVAGGFMIQVLPGASDEAISKLEKTLKDLPLVSEMLRDGDTPEDILKKIFGDDLKILDQMPVRYECDCSKQRFAHALESISTKDLKKLIDEDHHAETVCRFCGKKYEFSEEELQLLYDKKVADAEADKEIADQKDEGDQKPADQK
ncbi:Hsp33 family molecular chaperone HslO [Limosilactobacillus sp.]|jgi:molecular chaperone Hsp33|uniref:Hsp33 family molecular chaperone HslO n=1 Tax=Limosilactobacillus sp. TaxID=2773925 RepID=UPI0025BE4878|nr:Hsp33 family molecular chaperone HslO [Limosilactobacillus sp.]MCH3922028.1 Hsp33 family molecular chaperone HslO [Limosilactobacillus sp.]MCH3928799.1 Hsp33 family molecular chaperone HslO [Limosilactobacillus sp.]